MDKIISFYILFLMSIGVLNAVEMVLERVKVEQWDENYLSNVTVNVRRVSRRSKQVLNIRGRTLHAWSNNVTFAMAVEEFLHNEYRPSFVTFRYKLCDIIVSNYLFLRVPFDLKCPVPPNFYTFDNITIQTHTFPGTFPIEKGRVNVRVLLTKTNHVILTANLYATFIN